MKQFLFFLIVWLAGCSSGAVVFAPTPAPPDLSPVRYDHPSGAFFLHLPPNWSVYSRNTTTLATAAFSPPNSPDPLLTVAVINLGEILDSSGWNDLLDRYQSQVRPDAARYTEQNRQAMGDGSWRLTGLRAATGSTQQINTFVQQTGTLLGVIDVFIPDDQASMAELQTIVNSLDINPDAALNPSQLSVLVAAAATEIDAVHVSAWTTPTGVFFITGEVVNNSGVTMTDVPVRAVLLTAEGLPVAEAVDKVMGYGLAPGEYAPFSLRFGQGQPPLTTTYELYLGSEDWQPQTDLTLVGADDLSWTDEFSFDSNGRLVITGAATNTGEDMVNRPRAVVTVFNTNQQVIAAGFSDLEVTVLEPGESAPYQIVVPDMGGEPAEYVVNVQAVQGRSASP